MIKLLFQISQTPKGNNVRTKIRKKKKKQCNARQTQKENTYRNVSRDVRELLLGLLGDPWIPQPHLQAANFGESPLHFGVSCLSLYSLPFPSLFGVQCSQGEESVTSWSWMEHNTPQRKEEGKVVCVCVWKWVSEEMIKVSPLHRMTSWAGKR